METKKRILLVDDEQTSLEFFDVMLSKLGFEIKKAENGEIALQTLKHWKPDLIMQGGPEAPLSIPVRGPEKQKARSPRSFTLLR